MKQRTFYIALMLVLACQKGLAQYDSEFQLPQVIPSSPTSFEFTKQGQIPVGMFTGTPNVSIPLYTISTGGYSLPLSLGYSSNGIKVDQMATEVGLGWTLNAGGVITRVLRDEADEESRVSLPNVGVSSNEMKIFLSGTILSEGSDTQPDLFSFNFNGYSGKFYLDDNMEPLLVEPSPLKIERFSVTYKITDPKGIEYYFGEGNAYEESFNRTYGVGGSADNIPTAPVVTAWYLTRVHLPSGNEIKFTYTDRNSFYDLSISQNVYASKKIQSNVNGGYPYYIPASHQLPVITRQFSKLALLDSIKWESGYTKLNYSQRYTGISTSLQKLDTIMIYDKDGTLFKKVGFSFDQYDALSSFNNPDNTGIDPSNSKRFFLKGVDMFSRENESVQKYAFEYYSPNQMPPRLSYAQDYWGHFNGKSNTDLVSNDISLYNPSSYDDPELSYTVLQGLFSNVGGDKSPDPNFAVKGLLKKITYPTGGYNEFQYEAHSLYGPQEIPSSLTPIYININTPSELKINSQSATTVLIPYYQEKRPIYFSSGLLSCWDIGWPEDKQKAILSVRVAPSGSSTFTCPTNGFYQINANGMKSYSNGGCSIEAFADVMNPQYYIDLYEGFVYQFTVSLNWECLRGDFSFSYYGQAPQIVNANIPVGGMRIKQVLSNDNQGNQTVKNYHYGDLDCIDCSSGEMEVIRPAISFRTYDYMGSTQTHEAIASLSSGTLRPLYDSGGYHISYHSVIEEIGSSFSGGGTIYQYNTIMDNLPYVYGDRIPGTPYTNGFGNGEELSRTSFRYDGANYIKIAESEYHYKNDDTRMDNSLEGFTASVRMQFSAPFDIWTTTNTEYNLNKFYQKSKWRYIDQTIEKQYDQNGQNPLETVTNYYYDNPDHLQLSRTETYTSDDRTILTTTYYPDDIKTASILQDDSSINGGGFSATSFDAIHRMIYGDLHQIAIPVQTETIVKDPNGNELSRSMQRTNFSAPLTNTDIILPSDLQTLKGTYNPTSNLFQERIAYKSYYENGNIREVSKTDGTRILYVWGYGDQYPIAKIENATYETGKPNSLTTGQLDQIDAAVSASDLDDSRCTDLDPANCNEKDLRTALNVLRGSLSNAQVTTYTYDPLVGVTSITDPKGYTVYYDYDDFNRLKQVKDANGKIVTENEYHYKGQQ